MSKQFKVSQIMTKNVVVAGLNNTFKQVLDFFVDHKIHHLPVAFDDKILGILSYSDVLKFMTTSLRLGNAVTLDELDASFKMGDVMTHNPITVSPDDEAEKVIQILSEGKFQSVIVAKEGLIYGIVSNKDLIRLYQYEKEHQE